MAFAALSSLKTTIGLSQVQGCCRGLVTNKTLATFTTGLKKAIAGMESTRRKPASMLNRQSTRPSSSLSEFKKAFSEAKHVVALTGAGVSAESGIPTFRGPDGFWKQYEPMKLATTEAFTSNPSLVWQFYHYRRELVMSREPNAAHYALADAEKRFKQQNKRFVIVTQNIDELHKRAGSENVIELHGTFFKTRCTSCGDVAKNYDSPIAPKLKNTQFDDNEHPVNIPLKELPTCKKCSGGLLRPAVVWFGEALDPAIMDEANKELDRCDLCLVIGTSSIVYPAAMFAPAVASRGVPVAEFNIESTPNTGIFGFHFEGECSKTLVEAIKD